MTYQKANAIVKAYLFEDSNRINQLKYKIAKKFNLIHYIYSFLYAKIYNRTNHFGIKRKNDFDFQFQLWRKEKQQKFIAKDPNNYENRKIEKEEQAPINLDDVEENTSKKNKLNKKKRMLEEKLKENDKAMKKIKQKNNVN